MRKGALTYTGKELERKRNEVSNIVDNMDGDDVTNTISDYLKRRGQNNR